MERLSICEIFADLYVGVPLPSQSMSECLQLRRTLDSALPELYAAIIVFAVKARSYFEASSTYVLSSIGCNTGMLINYAN